MNKEINKEINKKIDKSTENIESSTEDSVNENKEEYTFVRETIKEKPPVVVRVVLRIFQILGMGIVFGLGVCLVLFAFDKDIRDIFTDDGEEKTVENNTQEVTTVPKETGMQEAISVEESINSSLVDVEVVIYKSETEGQTDETQSATDETTGIYQEEDGTASISDNKEVNTTGNKETTVQDETSIEEETTVEETTEKRQIEEKRHYTGVIIDKKRDLYICIAYDKVKDGDALYVTLGNKKNVEAELYGSENINGMAVLKVNAKDIETEVLDKINKVSVADIDVAGSGDKLIYVGKPYGAGRLFYAGTLAGVDEGHSSYDTFYRHVITDISNNDTSDGFIFNEKGELVAMLGAGAGEKTAGKNITGVCMEDMVNTVNALIYKTTIGHIGIKGETVNDDMRDLTQEVIPDGMYVTDVARDSTAYKSGIMVGDIITTIEGKEVKSIRDIQNVIQFLSANETVTIVLKRKIGTNYNEFTIKVPVEAY